MTKLKPSIDPVASATYACDIAAKVVLGRTDWHGVRGGRCATNVKRGACHRAKRRSGSGSAIHETLRTLVGAGFGEIDGMASTGASWR